MTPEELLERVLAVHGEIPCRRTLGHGDFCSEGHLCGMCALLSGEEPEADIGVPLGAFQDFLSQKGPGYLEGRSAEERGKRTGK